MANALRYIQQGIELRGETSDDSSATEGSLFHNSTSNRLKSYIQGAVRELVTNSQAQTLTNKTIDADSNTISNIDNADIKSAAAIDRSKLASGTANRVAVNDASGVLSDAAAITASRALVSDANGIPTHATTTATEIGFVNGVTSAIQTQLNAKALDSDLTTHISDTTTHGTTGNILGTSDTQVVTNKDIDGGTASNSSRITVPKAAKATLDALTRKEATLVYASDEDKLYVDDGTNLLVVGSGAGSYDIFFQDDFSVTTVSTFASGNNATFLGGGTLQGVLSNETSAPIKGIRSAKYTMAVAGSTNDYFALAAITPSTKERGNYVGMDVYHTYDGASGDIKYVVYDVTNSQVLSSSLDTVVNATIPTRTSLSFLLPATCASLRIGAQVVTHNASKVFVFDDIQLSVNPFVYKNLTVSQTLSLTDSPGYGATNTKIRRFTNTQVSSGSNLFTYVDSATLGGSFTFLQACRVSISYMFEKSSVGTSNEGISINSSQLTTDIGSITAANRLAIGVAASTINTLATVSWTGYVAAGDVIRAHGQGTATNTIIPVFSITAQSEAENVISAAQSNMTDWALYSPTYTGFGTPSVDEVYWRRNGSNLEMRGRFTPGTTTAVEARLGFPTVAGSLLVSAGSSVITALTHAYGSWLIAGANTQHGGLTLMEPSVSYMTFSKLTTFSGTNSDPYQKEIGNVGFGSSSVTFSASIPINGWTSDVKFLAAIPVQKVAYLKDIKADTTDGGTFTSGAWQTRTLNTINETGSSTTSSSTFVTLSSNQFTLPPGEYMIDWEAPAFAVDQHQTRLRNITDTTTDGLGTRSNSSSGSSGFSNSIGHIKLTITSSKVYEIQHQCGTTKATNGFGSGTSSFSESVVYSQVKITRLR